MAPDVAGQGAMREEHVTMPRYLVTTGLSLTAVLIIGCWLIKLDPARAAPDQGSAVQQRLDDSPCIAEKATHIDPKVLLLGESTEITLKAQIMCAGETGLMRIVLVLDASDRMAGDPIRQLKDAATELVRGLDLPDNPDIQVGVVAFSDDARTMAQLTNSEARVLGAISRIRAGGGQAVEAGIEEGLKAITRGRNSARPGRVGAGIDYEFLVLMSIGPADDCGPAIRAANGAKREGVLVASVCTDHGCNEWCMRRIATSSRYYFKPSQISQLVRIFGMVRSYVFNIRIDRLTVKNVLLDRMRYVPGSAVPEPSYVSLAGDVIQWTTDQLPRDGVTYTLKVEPIEPGFGPTSVEISGAYEDNLKRRGRFDFEIPRLTTLRPAIVPTPATAPP